MTHRQHLNQLRAALNFATRVAAELEQEVQDGRAAEYEQRQGFDPGYIAGRAAGWRAWAGILQSEINTLKTNYEKR